MRPIDADALEKEGWSLHRTIRVDKNTAEYQTMPLANVPDIYVGECEDTISRQAAIDALSHMMDIDGFRDGWAVSRANVECMLKAMPSAQPKIIRCKDCKHSEHWYRDKCRCFLWHKIGIDVYEDGFCNYAERT